jgi:hypothetical protein
VVDVVVGTTQPDCPQASQQLAKLPTQAWPPLGAAHRAVVLLSEHEVLPLALVRQQVLVPGLPQVDLDAHLLTDPVHPLFTSDALACWAAHRT